MHQIWPLDTAVAAVVAIAAVRVSPRKMEIIATSKRKPMLILQRRRLSLISPRMCLNRRSPDIVRFERVKIQEQSLYRQQQTRSLRMATLRAAAATTTTRPNRLLKELMNTVNSLSTNLACQ